MLANLAMRKEELEWVAPASSLAVRKTIKLTAAAMPSGLCNTHRCYCGHCGNHLPLPPLLVISHAVFRQMVKILTKKSACQ